MSEHDSHDDPALSVLYRRSSREEPSPQLDERVMAMARRTHTRRSPRWWLPLSTAAVMVLTFSLLLRHQQAPDDLQRELAEYEPSPAASEPALSPPPAPAQVVPESEAPRKKASAAAKPESLARSSVAKAPAAAAAQSGETEKGAAPPAETAKAEEPPLAYAAPPADTNQAEAAASRAMPRASAELKQKREEAVETPEPWLRRIEALRAKGELDAARRELVAFRKAYPDHALPKELQALLPEAAK